MNSSRSASDHTSAAYRWNIGVSATVRMTPVYGNAVLVASANLLIFYNNACRKSIVDDDKWVLVLVESIRLGSENVVENKFCVKMGWYVWVNI